MRILIVGGTSALAQVLKPVLAEFSEVITAGRKDCDIHLDLDDAMDDIVLPADIDVAINMAAGFGGKGFEDIFETESTNVLGTLKLCNACTKAKVGKLVLISTIFASLEKESSFYNIYSLSKKHSDEVAQLYCSSFGLPLVIIRPSQFYGTGPELQKHHPFFSMVIDRIANGEDVSIYGSNDAKRNFIHLEDVAQAISIVVKRKIEGIYACMSLENVSYFEITEAAIEAFESKSAVKFVKEQPDIPDNIFPVDDTLFRLIDYFPQISIKQGMQKEAAYRKKAR